MQAKVTSKGQITIPKKIRDYMQLNESDKVDFKVGEDGAVYITKPQKSIMDLCGSLNKYKKDRPVTVEEMHEAVLEVAAERHRKCLE